jgi:hypothetical protein
MQPSDVSAYVARAEALTFELMHQYGITDHAGASGADVVLLVHTLNQRLREEYPQFPDAYVTIGLVEPPARAGQPWKITLHAYEHGVELRRQVIRSA